MTRHIVELLTAHNKAKLSIITITCSHLYDYRIGFEGNEGGKKRDKIQKASLSEYIIL